MKSGKKNVGSAGRNRSISLPWPALVAAPVVSGGLWLLWAVQGGPLGILLGALPGTLLFATGLSNLLWAGDARIFQFMALGALSGMLLSLPAALVSGPLAAVVLLAVSGASFVVTGYLTVDHEPAPEEVPETRLHPRLAARAAGDEVSMAGIVLTTWPLSVGRRAARIGTELDDALQLFDHRGWLDDPASYHQAPTPPKEVHSETRQHRGREFEHLSFESGYEPWPEEPGRGRWLSYEANRTAHAWILRHPGEPRPWLVGLHGIRMGSLRGDFFLYNPDFLHEELGLNLVLPVLPIHGPRKVGPVSGDRILSGDVMDTVHAGAQAIWDVRRLISWLRLPEQNAPAVGVLGYSLGGYTAALLAGLENNLDGVTVANPAVDPSGSFWRSSLSASIHYLKAEGVTEEKMSRLLRVVSPLSFDPIVPKDRRAIFAGVADRIVPPSEALSLWRHWDRPRVVWYQGTHRGFLRTEEGKRALTDTLRASGLLSGNE